MFHRRFAPIGVAWGVLAACGGDPPSDDPSLLARRDSGVLADSGVRDSGIRDSGIRDSGIRDSGIRDSGPADTGTADASAPDARADAAAADAAAPDATADGGSIDAGSADAGADPCATSFDQDGVTLSLYWGTLHEHTAWSLDAYFAGMKDYGPAEAYEFAKGLRPITLPSGDVVTPSAQSRLDWAAITDHAEFFDTQYGCIFNPDQSRTSAYNSLYCAGVGPNDTGSYRNGGVVRQSQLAARSPSPPSAFCSNYDCDGFERSMWDEAKSIAENFNDTTTCSFVTLPAFEYSSNYFYGTDTASRADDKIANMHRNVIFRSSATTRFPLDYISYDRPEQMWAALDSECVARDETTTVSKPCSAISIPHNPNDSAGEKWTLATSDAENRLRGRFETLVEIHQHKGSSECLNASETGTDGQNGYDALCEFELATTTTGETDQSDGAGGHLCVDTSSGAVPTLTGKPCRRTDAAGYVRAGLGKGLVEYAARGYDPLKLGIVAATDSHNATPGYTSDSAWKGHAGSAEDTPSERTEVTNSENKPNLGRRNNPGGLTAVWAKHLRRADVYDALAARESYGTSGTRPSVLFFQVWDQVDYCARAPNGAYVVSNADLRRAGRPMGSTMGAAPTAGAMPRFIVRAEKDSAFSATSGLEAHNIQQVDLIQSRAVSAGGQTVARDAIFRVTAASSDGATSFCATFSSGDMAIDGTSVLTYEAAVPSLWYARVVETPSWSWRYYDCEWLRLNTATRCAADITAPDAGGNPTYDTPMAKIRERAWTSPIWHLP